MAILLTLMQLSCLCCWRFSKTLFEVSGCFVPIAALKHKWCWAKPTACPLYYVADSWVFGLIVLVLTSQIWWPAQPCRRMLLQQLTIGVRTWWHHNVVSTTAERRCPTFWTTSLKKKPVRTCFWWWGSFSCFGPSWVTFSLFENMMATSLFELKVRKLFSTSNGCRFPFLHSRIISSSQTAASTLYHFFVPFCTHRVQQVKILVQPGKPLTVLRKKQKIHQIKFDF